MGDYSEDGDFFCSLCVSDEFKCSLCKKQVIGKGFRCIRCDLLSHPQCQVHQSQQLDEPYPLSKFMNGYKCAFCLAFDASMEAIICLEKTDPVKDKDFGDSKTKALVKFDGSSHLHDTWVPLEWLGHLKDFRPRYRLFRKRVGDTDEYLDESFGPESIKIQKILDVELTRGSKSNLAKRGVQGFLKTGKIDQILVKWACFGYEQVSWEDFPDSPEYFADTYPTIFEVLSEKFGLDKTKIMQDLYDSVLEKMDEYISRLKLSANYTPGTANDRRFKEITKQPACVKNGSLKDYQMDGLNWLIYKWVKKTPCVLADEMGLGKTVQIAAFFSVLSTEHRIWPFMVVAPTSLLTNWYNELTKWAPHLVSVIYNGTKTARDLILNHEILPDDTIDHPASALRCHVVLTNYETLMSEATLFTKIKWRVLVCDEGHRLKNDAAKTFQAFTRIDVDHRIVLTGTPLQNNMKELFSLMKFLDRDEFENQKEWEEKYADLNEASVLTLHATLKPYFLRRTKQLVLKSLPSKTEVLVPVSLTPIQAELYKAILSRNLNLLRSIGTHIKASTSDTTAKATASLQNIMMELRKVCGHPYLLGPEIEPTGLDEAAAHQALVDACGKLQLLQMMLPRLKDRGHRVLIFSQFKIALDVIEDFLNGEQLTYCRLDGETPSHERQRMIDEYNAPGSELFAFLLTTRTGGLGLNLATADTIIIYDADWNPHQDHQAIARAHRIGQTKPVVVYKLFTKNCVEEKIIEIGKRKLVLDHLVVEKMDSQTLDKQELTSILKFGVEALFGLNENGEKAAEDKTIKYDVAAVEKLLERKALIQEDKPQGDEAHGGTKTSFSFARVWTLDEELTQAGGDASGGATVAAEDGGAANGGDVKMEDQQQPVAENVADDTIWDELLKKTQQDGIAGAGGSLLDTDDYRLRRRRRNVNYNENSMFASPSKRQKREERTGSGGGTGVDGVDNNDVEWEPNEEESASDVGSDPFVADDSNEVLVPPEQQDVAPPKDTAMLTMRKKPGRPKLSLSGSHYMQALTQQQNNRAALNVAPAPPVKERHRSTSRPSMHGSSNLRPAGSQDFGLNILSLVRGDTANPSMPKCLLCPDARDFHHLEICKRAREPHFLQVFSTTLKNNPSSDQADIQIDRYKLEILRRLYNKSRISPPSGSMGLGMGSIKEQGVPRVGRPPRVAPIAPQIQTAPLRPNIPSSSSSANYQPQQQQQQLSAGLSGGPSPSPIGSGPSVPVGSNVIGQNIHGSNSIGQATNNSAPRMQKPPVPVSLAPLQSSTSQSSVLPSLPRLSAGSIEFVCPFCQKAPFHSLNVCPKIRQDPRFSLTKVSELEAQGQITREKAVEWRERIANIQKSTASTNATASTTITSSTSVVATTTSTAAAATTASATN